MRQTHAEGDEVFVDFAGDTVPVFDGLTGRWGRPDLVAVMGASNYTFAQARSARRCPIGSAPMDALGFPGRGAEGVVCDNLKGPGGGHGGEPLRAGVNGPTRTSPPITNHHHGRRGPAKRATRQSRDGVLIVQRGFWRGCANAAFLVADLNNRLRNLVDELNAP